MGRFFSFETLITTDFVRAFYLLGMIVISLAGTFFLLGFGRGVLTIEIPGNTRIVGAVLLILGNLVWRIICEGWILFFRMHESLVEIQTNTQILKQLRKKKT